MSRPQRCLWQDTDILSLCHCSSNAAVHMEWMALGNSKQSMMSQPCSKRSHFPVLPLTQTRGRWLAPCMLRHRQWASAANDGCIIGRLQPFHINPLLCFLHQVGLLLGWHAKRCFEKGNENLLGDSSSKLLYDLDGIACSPPPPPLPPRAGGHLSSHSHHQQKCIWGSGNE